MQEVFSNIGMTINGIKHLSPREAYGLLMKDVILVDVREDYMIGYKKFDVRQVIYVPYSECSKSLTLIPMDSAIIVADSFGLRSKETVKKLIDQGHKNVANLIGGIIEWERDGLPLSVDKKEELNGPCPCQLKKRK